MPYVHILNQRKQFPSINGKTKQTVLQTTFSTKIVANIIFGKQ